jgi:hypothetical protein
MEYPHVIGNTKPIKKIVGSKQKGERPDELLNYSVLLVLTNIFIYVPWGKGRAEDGQT